VIVVDSSAIIAFAFGEPEAETFYDILTAADASVCSPVTFAECAMVLIGKQAAMPMADIISLFRTLRIEQSGFGSDQGQLAAEAFLRFGKSRHPARLNMGDCFSYALAKSLNAPLLYKGDDFSRTDIASALVTGVRP
jgi:ribonuclease VapC